MVYYLSFIVLYSCHHAPRIFRHNPMFFFIIFNRVSQGLSSFSTGFLRVYHHFQPGFSGFIRVFPFFHISKLSKQWPFLIFPCHFSPRSVLAKVEPWDEVMAGASEILNHAEGAGLGSLGSGHVRCGDVRLVPPPVVMLVTVSWCYCYGKWMFIPLKMVLIGIDPYPYKPQ